ncbi:MAG: hypothetical protein KGL15_04845 [Acidobacteriota bacterium]|nr:hypothetical protein [Acidobacteriota bacterium]
MSTGGFKVAHRLAPTRLADAARWAQAHFFSDSRRRLHSALGTLWLLDGALQLPPSMYSKGSLTNSS